MKIVVDANILFSALIKKDSFTRKFLVNDRFELYTSEFFFEEYTKHLATIAKKTKLSERDIRDLLNEFLLEAKIRVFANPELESFREEAEKICPDPDDVFYFQLALKLDCPIWSNDKALKKQDKIKIYTTKELLDL
jgi:predicted nucleic acid-binding protein